MHEQLPLTDFDRLAGEIERLRRTGNRIVVVDNGDPIAEVTPIPAPLRLCDLPEFFRSLPRLAPGDADEFADDLVEIQASAARPLPPPTWD